MKGKVLIVASVASMIDQFNMDNISILQRQGYDVHVAANFSMGSTTSKNRMIEFKCELEKLNITIHQIDFSRGIQNILLNLKAYKQLSEVTKKLNYKFIHCHSPIGGVIGRIVAKRKKIPVIYTVHGFHFFKGGPLKNWMFFPIEFILSYLTDILITINKEDFELAQKYFKSKKNYYIPGVGIDYEKFKNIHIDKNRLRESLNIPNEGVLFISVGELSKRKNHQIVIKALSRIKKDNYYYIICGRGKEEEKLNNLINKYGLEGKVILLGFRKDVSELCKASDVYVFPSLREGLGLAAIEAMATGLPLVCSYVNGIKDYLQEEVTGYGVKPYDIDGFVNGMVKLGENYELRNKIGKTNIEISEKFSIKKINEIMKKIYKNINV